MSRLLLCDVRGPVGDLFQKLSGEEGGQWLEALNKMLRRENPFGVREEEAKEVPLPLTWLGAIEKSYGLLGLAREYAEFQKEFSPIEEVPDRWALPMVKGVTCNRVASTLRQAGSGFSSYYEDMDEAVPTNQRDPNRDGSYVASVKAVVEADEENKNQSAQQRGEQGCQDITLAERLFLELVYSLKTGKHLDIQNWTLCAGSRDAGGYVPSVSFVPGSGEVYVDWGSLSDHSGGLRARSVVSSPPKQAKPV